MKFKFHYDEKGGTLIVPEAKQGLIARLFGGSKKPSIAEITESEWNLAFALGDLRLLGENRPNELRISDDSIRLSHRIMSELSAEAAETIGLPPVVDLTFKTDVEGSLGSSDFQLSYQWHHVGHRLNPRRTGAMLETSKGLRRIPSWMLRAIEVADGFIPGGDLQDQWTALAEFRNALEPEINTVSATPATRAMMTDFLRGLEVRIADRFSITPFETPDGLDFEVVPFSGKRLDQEKDTENEVSDAQAEFIDAKLQTFQKRIRTHGARGSYRVADGSYLIIDKSALPVLELMSEKQKGGREVREEFIENPRPFITQVVAAALRDSGALEDLSPEGEEEAIEAAAGPLFVETIEYSERVTGKIQYARLNLGIVEPTGTTWLPETFPEPLRSILAAKDPAQIDNAITAIQDALDAGQPTCEIEGTTLHVSPELLERAILARDMAAEEEGARTESTEPESDKEEAGIPGGPIVLDTMQNFEAVTWETRLKPRRSPMATVLPSGVTTSLKEHQNESFAWQIEAWRAGLPGVLNADEQGLGKTLQTIAFLRWLKSHMETTSEGARGPMLVVAPTSLLTNWAAEVNLHLDFEGLGNPIQLYGSGISSLKRAGSQGIDTDSGEAKLDLGKLEDAIRQGKGYRFWVLTTYTTLTNYQHSLGRIPFSAAVFDEIQTIKNPVSLRAVAARAVNADFRIGLTGTPIENSVVDLWAIMDQLCPGKLGGLIDFRNRYRDPSEESMQDLHSRVFRSETGIPPAAIRRLKETVARELPSKTRRLHPRKMPPKQATEYERARIKLMEGGKGSALKMLHHIRTVSVHPSLGEFDPDGVESFVSASARLSAVMDVLKAIRERDERALIFIEHRQMQYRFIELARMVFGLQTVDLINGDTPIAKRQEIVNRFQSHLANDRGFDLLVLGPKAAGTGLTLTAATHVIHLSRWWNPAVEEQCNDRVHRIGQTREITVHLPMAIHPLFMEGSFDCRLNNLMTRKRRLATSALWPMGDTPEDAGDLQRSITGDMTERQGDPVTIAMENMFREIRLPVPPFEADGSLICPNL